MYYTRDILKIFYNCCELPIALIDNNYNIINSEGFKDGNPISLNDAPSMWFSDDNINYYIIPQKNKKGQPLDCPINGILLSH